MSILNGTTQSFRIRDIYLVPDEGTGWPTLVVDELAHEKYKARSEAAKRGWEGRRAAKAKREGPLTGWGDLL